MKKIIFIILFLFLIACEQRQVVKVTCNKPYILVGASCCLDNNDNSICDEDEVNEEILTEKTTLDENEEKKFRETAEDFGRFVEQDKFGDIYDMLHSRHQKYKTRDEFIYLYPKFKGRDTYRSVILKQIDMESDEIAIAYYDVTFYNGYQETSGSIYFNKENGEWKLDSFGIIIFAGCKTTSDCYRNPQGLKIMCEETCKEKTNYPLRTDEGKEFECKNYLCNCKCFKDGFGKPVEPDIKHLN
ncbi:hypothetical protein CEE44_00680 [Candidatus Woesearchaeota archaeon B3_Woes]|nr:MAG: hypothetical protein CEE44_00680 [Candidatus Woesearchaeota archaeon B3_Woes]